MASQAASTFFGALLAAACLRRKSFSIRRASGDLTTQTQRHESRSNWTAAFTRAAAIHADVAISPTAKSSMRRRGKGGPSSD